MYVYTTLCLPIHPRVDTYVLLSAIVNSASVTMSIQIYL